MKVPRRCFLLSGLSLSVLVTLSFPASASGNGAMSQMIESELQKSTQRAEALNRGLQWPMTRLGDFLVVFFHGDSRNMAWIVYQDRQKDLISLSSPQRLSRTADNKSTLALFSSLRRLWWAENRLRWIFFRNMTVGMILSGTVLLVAGWRIARFCVPVRRRSDDPESQRSSRFPVIPDQPLSFHPPQALLDNQFQETGLYRQVQSLGLLSPLTEKVLACYAASQDHPASLTDHLNVPGGLMEHTSQTIKIITRLTGDRQGEERRLVFLFALCHDLGKILNYERVGTHWIDRNLPHDRLSGLMVAGLPELYTELSPTHREAFLLALRYYHNPEELPTTAPPICHSILETMHKADALAHETEKENTRVRVEGIKPHLWDAFTAALPHLNINRHKGGYPEGFTTDEAVFVLEHALRERSLDQLPLEFQQRLPIRRPTGKLHPAWPLLVEILREKGIISEGVSGRKANPSALYNINAGGTPYKCVVALSLEALKKLVPNLVKQWQEAPPYEIRISGGRYVG